MERSERTMLADEAISQSSWEPGGPITAAKVAMNDIEEEDD